MIQLQAKRPTGGRWLLRCYVHHHGDRPEDTADWCSGHAPSSRLVDRISACFARSPPPLPSAWHGSTVTHTTALPTPDDATDAMASHCSALTYCIIRCARLKREKRRRLNCCLSERAEIYDRDRCHSQPTRRLERSSSPVRQLSVRDRRFNLFSAPPDANNSHPRWLSVGSSVQRVGHSAVHAFWHFQRS